MRAIQAATTERELEMLALMVKGMRDKGRRPDALYLDNGSTYRREVLQTLCARLGIGLLHAEAEDPQARGKYLEEVMRVLPHWPDSRYLELAPINCARTRAKLLPAELDAPFGSFTVPAA